MTVRLTLGAAAIAVVTAVAAGSLVPVEAAESTSLLSARTAVAAKRDGGSLRVIASGVPQGRSAKITISGKKYRKKLPSEGRLRNLKPGRYRVWAAPIVVNGGTAAVAQTPVVVRVPKRRAATVRLQYQWNPKTDSYPPGPVTGLQVTDVRATTASLRWVNSMAPDLQGVAIRRKLGPVAPKALDDGKVVAVDPSGTSVTDTGLRQFTQYSYSVFMTDTSGNASTPVSATVRTSGHAVAVSAGTQHTCALLADTHDGTVPAGGGQVACWGANDHGQLGIGTTMNADSPQVVDIDGVDQLAAAGDHTCALLADRTVWCWGRNDHGQLGTGTTRDSTVPVRTGLASATSWIAAGGDHTCAVSLNDGLRCWGDNQFGQSGQKSSEAILQIPSTPIATSVTSVAAGWSHTCYVRNGTVRCLGANDDGQLGNGTTDPSSSGILVPGLTKVTGVSAGVAHTCAVSSDETLECWGENSTGQIGDGSTTQRLVPVSVEGSFVSVSAGAYHTCAVTDSGQARCWGRNQSGRLGDETSTDRDHPTRVALFNPVMNLAAGGYHSCAVTGPDTYCWGSNALGQVGVRDAFSVLRPTSVTGL